MRLLGLEITRAKKKALQPPSGGRWFSIYDQYTGAWQQDASVDVQTVLTFSAVFACIRLISADIGKMPLRLMERIPSGIWAEVENAAFSPVLRKPNPIQTRIKFIEQWLISKLCYGNTYVLKRRDNRGVVYRMNVLDPTKVQALVSDDGQVFYRLRRDNTVRVGEEITIPATEIIHDVHVTFDHPLVGISPIGACGLTAAQGLNIQRNSKNFFGNQAMPAGMLTAPGAITPETAARLKADWETKFSGDNFGKIAVAGDGLEFKPFSMSAVDAQLIEQLKWTAADVCTAFGVPAYKIGVGPMPTTNNMGALDQSYYDDTLQELIDCIELLLFEGLELPTKYRAAFDLDHLLKMDAASRYAAYEQAIRPGWLAPNEARVRENLAPVKGGDEPFIQQQNWPLSVLVSRPPPDAAPPSAAPAAEPAGERDDPPEDKEKVAGLFTFKNLTLQLEEEEAA